jgi:ribulose-phosphate 3-epimerase
MGIVIPAVLPFSKKEFDDDLELFSTIPTVSRVQIDVVDGKFAAPASWPYSASSEATEGKPTELETMVQKSEMLPHLDRIEYEIDLMCFDAERIAEAWLARGATRLVFHAESAIDLQRLLTSTRERYDNEFTRMISFGLAVHIETDVALIEPYVDTIEFVQFMGIAQIGRQGQPFDTRVLEKVRIFRMRHPGIPVQVDGGISFDNAKKLIALGVSNLVVGSGILRATNPTKVVTALEELMSSYGV